MSSWIKRPDDRRGTGRTIKMIESVLSAADKPGLIVVIAANQQHVKVLQRTLNLAGAHDKPATITVRSYSNLKSHGDPFETRYFWDHYAVECQTDDIVEAAFKKAGY